MGWSVGFHLSSYLRFPRTSPFSTVSRDAPAKNAPRKIIFILHLVRIIVHNSRPLLEFVFLLACASDCLW